jgi:NADH-quinone oxidoreductase subunit H
MWIIIEYLLIIVPIIISIAFVTLAERKVLGSMQIRKGPNVVGILGVLQPIADGVKLFGKETIKPTIANLTIFIMSPILSFLWALILYTVIPIGGYGSAASDINLGIMYILAISSISVYAILMSGWSSNSKYAFFGAIRAAAQMISYEVSLGIIILTIISCVGSFNMTNIIETQSTIWFIIPMLPVFIMCFVSALAETNRTPFDLTEGESELVSGFNVEYSAMTFALFFLAEYSNIIFMSMLLSVLFLGGYLPLLSLTILPPSFWLALKTIFLIYCWIWVRGSLPRMRYDQLMALIWKSFLPASLGYLLLVISLLYYFNGLPYPL